MNILKRKNKDLAHPATTMSFDKLYKGLMKRVESGLINIQKHRGLEIFSYSKSCVYEGAWDKFTVAARGLILCPHFQHKKIVGLAFPKFWNYGEVSTKLPNLGFRAFTKYDGSLGICFFNEGKWQVATKGSFQSEQAVWATDYLNKYASLDDMDPNITYLTEIIVPWNKIVVSYSFSGLVLLSGYHLDSGIELTRDEVIAETTAIGFIKSKEENYVSLDDMLVAAETLDSDNEGFVVRFSNGYRIKIKGSEYCRIHRLISNCTPLAIWDMMRNLDDLDVIRVDLTEEHQRDFDKIRSLLLVEFYKYIDEIIRIYEDTIDLSDKELGLKLKAGELNKYSKVARGFVFACRKRNFLIDVYKVPESKSKNVRNALFEAFRPVGNVLEGFNESSAEDRFDL
mgnify:CR=1 FL=1